MPESETFKTMTIADILKEAIQNEHASYDYYHKAASVAVKPVAKKMFLKLAEMEKGHASELRKYLLDLEAQIQIDKALTASF